MVVAKAHLSQLVPVFRVTNDRVCDLTHSVDAAFLLHGHRRLRWLPQIEQHALMLAGGVVQADALFPGLRLHQDQLPGRWRRPGTWPRFRAASWPAPGH